MWAYALQRYRVARPAVDTPESVLWLFSKLLDDACIDDDRRECRVCPHEAKRRAVLCDVCAHKRHAPPRK